MSDERTPADDYREAYEAVVEARRRWEEAAERESEANSEWTRLGSELREARDRLHDWITGNE